MLLSLPTETRFIVWSWCDVGALLCIHRVCRSLRDDIDAFTERSFREYGDELSSFDRYVFVTQATCLYSQMSHRGIAMIVDMVNDVWSDHIYSVDALHVQKHLCFYARLWRRFCTESHGLLCQLADRSYSISILDNLFRHVATSNIKLLKLHINARHHIGYRLEFKLKDEFVSFRNADPRRDDDRWRGPFRTRDHFTRAHR